MLFIYPPRLQEVLGFQQTIALWDNIRPWFSSNFAQKMWEVKSISVIVLGLVLGFIFLYRRSQNFRFHIKYFGFHCTVMCCAVCCFFIGAIHPFDVENFHRAKHFVYNALVTLFSIRVNVQGLEIFKTLKGKNFVIVANHQSSLDLFPLLKATPQSTTFLAKKELLFAPLFGLSAWLFGVVFINRGHAKSARDVMDKTAKKISERKVNVWIFPEGTRSQSGTLLPFKKGAFHLAQQAQLPIVPIVVYDYSSVFNKKSKTFSAGIIKVKVLPPIPTDGKTADDVSDLTENIREVMLKVFHEHDPLDRKDETSSVADDQKIK